MTDADLWAYDGGDPLPPKNYVNRRYHNLEMWAGLRLAMEETSDDGNRQSRLALARSWDEDDHHGFVSSVIHDLFPILGDGYDLLDPRLREHISVEMFAREMSFVLSWDQFWNEDKTRAEMMHYVEKVNTTLVAALVIRGDLGI